MPRGRPRTPTAIRILEGNPSGRPLPQNEPESAQLTVAYPAPSWLSKRAAIVWHRVLAVLCEMRVMTLADVEAVSLLCETTVEYWAARSVVRRKGATYESHQFNKDGDIIGSKVVKRPEVLIAADAAKRMKSLYEQFGLTASSRSRVKAAKVEDADPFEVYLSAKSAP